MKKEKAMRQCIKCGKIVPLGWFNDNWRNKSNICKDCRTYYGKHLEYPKVIKGYMFSVGDSEHQVICANTLEEEVFVKYLFQFLEDAIRRKVDVRKMLEIVEKDHKIAQI